MTREQLKKEAADYIKHAIGNTVEKNLITRQQIYIDRLWDKIILLEELLFKKDK